MAIFSNKIVESLFSKLIFPANWNPWFYPSKNHSHQNTNAINSISFTSTSSKSQSKSKSPQSKNSIISKFVSSAGSSDFQSNKPCSTNPPLSPEGGPINVRLYDCCVHVIICPEHNRIATIRQAGNILWLPFTPLPLNRSWNNGALYGLMIVLCQGNAEQFITLQNNLPQKQTYLINIHRIQSPQNTVTFITRLVYYTLLDPKKYDNCCKDTTSQNIKSRLQWLPLYNVFTQCNQTFCMWGPEVVEFARWYLSPGRQKVVELGRTKLFQTFVPQRDVPRNAEEVMLKVAGITENDIQRLYLDFLDHLYPALHMTIWSFKQYMITRKFNHDYRYDQTDRLFQAFNYHRNGFISFHELLLGLVAMDPKTPHQIEGRIKFIFRYYSNNNKQGPLMNQNCIDLSKLIKDLYPKLSQTEFKVKISEAIQKIKEGNNNIHDIISNTIIITYKEFYQLLTNDDHYRTQAEKLCRNKKSIFPIASVMNQPKLAFFSTEFKTDSYHHPTGLSSYGVNKRTKENRFNKLIRYKNKQKEKKNENEVDGGGRNNNKCLRCINIKYQLVQFITKWSPSKRGSSQSIVITTMQEQQQLNIGTKIISDHDFYLNPENPATQLLTLIREFNSSKGTVHRPNGVLMNEIPKLISLFQLVQQHILKLLDSKEGKLVEVTSPCTVIGDIHGNLSDLISMEQTIWHRLPFGGNLLFLGDYVDRGRWGVECALYVFSLKVLFPHKVTLLRGNHEIRKIQEKYSFQDECIAKYQQQGRIIWDMLNEVFDRLPIAAILDDAIFCVHGGIPAGSNITLDTIAQHNRLDIRSPDIDQDMVWDMLWSDPINKVRYDELCYFQGEHSGTGFVQNRKRGAGWHFSEAAAIRFLNQNGLTHIARAHEVPPGGFWFHFSDNICVTLFSSSHYCGGQNLCAVMFVDQERMRLIIVDTNINEPATGDNNKR